MVATTVKLIRKCKPAALNLDIHFMTFCKVVEGYFNKKKSPLSRGLIRLNLFKLYYGQPSAPLMPRAASHMPVLRVQVIAVAVAETADGVRVKAVFVPGVT